MDLGLQRADGPPAVWITATGASMIARAFDDAQALLPADPVDPALPFLFLGGTHLNRWRGNAA